MNKLIFAGLLCAMVCVCAPGAAGTVLNVDLPKETLTERDAADRHISTRPEGLKVTRQSVIPSSPAMRRRKNRRAGMCLRSTARFGKRAERCSRADGWCSSRERMKSEHGFNIRRPMK